MVDTGREIPYCCNHHVRLTNAAQVTEGLVSFRYPLTLLRISIYGLAVSALWVFVVAGWRLTGLIRFR